MTGIFYVFGALMPCSSKKKDGIRVVFTGGTLVRSESLHISLPVFTDSRPSVA